MCFSESRVRGVPSFHTRFQGSEDGKGKEQLREESWQGTLVGRDQRTGWWREGPRKAERDGMEGWQGRPEDRDVKGRTEKGGDKWQGLEVYKCSLFNTVISVLTFENGLFTHFWLDSSYCVKQKGMNMCKTSISEDILILSVH